MAGPDKFVFDGFKDPDLTVLSAHTMNRGPGWTMNGNIVYDIFNNSARQFNQPITPTGWALTAMLEAEVPNRLRARFIDAGGVASFSAGLVFRGSDLLNYWVLQITSSPLPFGNQFFSLNKVVAGVQTNVLSMFSLPLPGAIHDIAVSLTGPVIAVTLDGVTQSASDNFNESASQFGLFSIKTAVFVPVEFRYFYARSRDMPANVFTIDGNPQMVEEGLLETLLRVESSYELPASGLSLRLFQNDITPSRLSVAADFVVADFSGYMNIDLGAWVVAVDTVEEEPVMQAPESVFTDSTGAVDNVIYGYYILDGGAVIAAEKFTTPVPMEDAGDTIRITPRLYYPTHGPI